jgi:hypothetical protein
MIDIEEIKIPFSRDINSKHSKAFVFKLLLKTATQAKLCELT